VGKFQSYISILARYLDKVGRVAMVGLMLLVVANVFGRYFFKSIPGTYDYVQLMMLIAVGFGVPWCTNERANIEVEILAMRLPQRAQNIMGSIVGAFSVAIFGVVSWQCVLAGNAAKAQNQVSLSVSVPLYPFYWSLALVLGVAAVAMVPSWVDHVVKAVKGDGARDEGAER
jgi:TRAP-type C4-dicarboxylate transport system permease small subunit